MSERLTRLFPLWAAVLAACALWQPQWWTPAKAAIVPLLVLVMLAVVLHNLAGLALGYWVPALFGLDPVTRRTLAIEVGMQNSGLSVALAVKYFSPAAALPGALFSLWHNLSGSLLAGWWRRRG
ncbi:hypothetical protein MIT9_P1064 [Methylomarinovum caldicuralii]|uniref:Bile acid:sodium symporter n=1 Tax=Methylomarinovum caldicuralii TaxID=438856 RepID=A0AAU9C7T8_9GAMM|nr:hypothetical protein [Methylomarinovum caldicuralii]BCX81486.1 hypothetical protein MIT9_P1064 [Methylomarinovum caldicuralii]